MIEGRLTGKAVETRNHFMKGVTMTIMLTDAPDNTTSPTVNDIVSPINRTAAVPSPAPKKMSETLAGVVTIVDQIIGDARHKLEYGSDPVDVKQIYVVMLLGGLKQFLDSYTDFNSMELGNLP